jgi:hypothetical protein
MVTTENSNGVTPKLALNRVEAAEAIGVSPATLDRLTLRGLVHPSRATRRPLYSVKELERFLKETTEADYTFPQAGASGLPGLRATKQQAVPHPGSNSPGVHPPTSGETNNSAENQNKKGKSL